MKKLLLSISCIASLSVAAQTTINESDLPSNGNTTTYYVLDSTASDMSNITGSGATWDYSIYGGYTNNDRAVIMDNASGSGVYAAATDSISIEEFTKTMYRHNADSLVTIGFSFTEATAGQVDVTYTNQGHVLNFPTSMGVSDVSDNVSGTVVAPGLSLTTPHSGIVTSKVDGEGTLMLAQNSYNNVLRIKIYDSIQTSLPSIKVTRTTYEYRKPSVSPFPLLTHTTIKVQGPVNDQYSIVHSIENHPGFAGIAKNDQPLEAKIYPNPTKGLINIQSPALNQIENIQILNSIGQLAKEVQFDNASQKVQLDVSTLPKGIYFVRIQAGNKVTTQKISVL